MTGSAHQRVARALRTRAGRLLAALRAAGARRARDALRFVRETVDIEANSATDNPMVFADTGEIVSGGNFHGAPIAIAADLLAAALVPLATISERRTDRLVNPALSGLPAFLTRDGGLQSGFMMAQVTAAAVASELKTLAHPACVDTIPDVGEQGRSRQHEHERRAEGRARRRRARARSSRSRFLCACQAIDLLAPLETSPLLARVHALVRSRVPTLDATARRRPISPRSPNLIESGELNDACGGVVK